jgi:hypothetical protein
MLLLGMESQLSEQLNTLTNCLTPLLGSKKCAKNTCCLLPVFLDLLQIVQVSTSLVCET